MKSHSMFHRLLLSVLLIMSIALPGVASAASIIYDAFYTNAFAGNILVNSNTFKCMLVTSSYTQNKGTHATRADITNEVSGTGYTAGGVACTVAGAIDTTNHRYDITVTGPSWSSATFTARQMIVYKNSGTASTDYLVAAIDFGSDITSTASTFQVTVSSPLRIQN